MCPVRYFSLRSKLILRSKDRRYCLWVVVEITDIEISQNIGQKSLQGSESSAASQGLKLLALVTTAGLNTWLLIPQIILIFIRLDEPGVVVNACNPSTLVGWGRRTANSVSVWNSAFYWDPNLKVIKKKNWVPCEGSGFICSITKDKEEQKREVGWGEGEGGGRGKWAAWERRHVRDSTRRCCAALHHPALK